MLTIQLGPQKPIVEKSRYNYWTSSESLKNPNMVPLSKTFPLSARLAISYLATGVCWTVSSLYEYETSDGGSLSVHC